MQEERYRDDNGIDIVTADELAIILVFRRIGADGLGGAVEVFLIDVTEREAVAVVDSVEVLEEVIAAAAGTDEAETHRVARGFDDGRRAVELRGGSDCARGGGEAQGVAAGQILQSVHLQVSL